LSNVASIWNLHRETWKTLKKKIKQILSIKSRDWSKNNIFRDLSLKAETHNRRINPE
jgi:hypothetical protein